MTAPMVLLHRLRKDRLAGALPDPEVAAWLADSTLRAIEGGTALLVEMGLASHGGAGGPSIVQQRARRDGLVKELYRRFYIDLTDIAAAEAIRKAVFHRRRFPRDPQNDQEQLIASIAAAWPELPTSLRQIVRIFDIQDPLWMSTGIQHS